VKSAAGLRIGIPRRFIADSVMSPARTAVFDRLLQSLAQAGIVIIDPCDLPSAEQRSHVRSCVFRTEFRASINSLLTVLKPCGMGSLCDIIAWNIAHPLWSVPAAGS